MATAAAAAAAATTTCGFLQLRRSSPIISPKIGAALTETRRRKSGSGLKVSAVIDNRVEFDENPIGILSGEWSENFSLLSYTDLKAYYAPRIAKDRSVPDVAVRSADEIDPEVIVSGEWPASSSLASYADLRAYFRRKGQAIEEEISPIEILSGEWPAYTFVASYDDLRAFYRPRSVVKSQILVREEADEISVSPMVILSGEWPENTSLASYDDLRAYYRPRSVSKSQALVREETDEISVSPMVILSGEWPANTSLASYDDLRAYYRPRSVAKSQALVREEAEEISPAVILSGEWPETFSLLSYEDLKAHYRPRVWERQAKRSAVLREVMSLKRAAKVDQTLEEIEHHFQVVSGLPVVDDEFHCVGIVTKEDKDRAIHGLKSKVGEVVSCPTFALSADKTVMEAADIMLKMHIHNIAILDHEKLIGIVNDSEILDEMEVASI